MMLQKYIQKNFCGLFLQQQFLCQKFLRKKFLCNSFLSIYFCNGLFCGIYLCIFDRKMTIRLNMQKKNIAQIRVHKRHPILLPKAIAIERSFCPKWMCDL